MQSVLNIQFVGGGREVDHRFSFTQTRLLSTRADSYGQQYRPTADGWSEWPDSRRELANEIC